jgi:hypothetical protein
VETATVIANEPAALAVCCASRIKPQKIACKGDFLPCKLRKEPIYRGFYGFFP